MRDARIIRFGVSVEEGFHDLRELKEIVKDVVFDALWEKGYNLEKVYVDYLDEREGPDTHVFTWAIEIVLNNGKIYSGIADAATVLYDKDHGVVKWVEGELEEELA